MHSTQWIVLLMSTAVLLFPFTLAAQLSGETYHGITLETLKNVRVVIGTDPPLQDITSEGRYSFHVEPGTYAIEASYWEDGIQTLTAKEVITIPGEGNYTYDAILFPPIEITNTRPLPAEAEIAPDIFSTLQQPIGILVVIGLLLLGIEAAIIITRKNKAPVSEPAYQIMEINNMLPRLPKEEKVKNKKMKKKNSKQTRLTP